MQGDIVESKKNKSGRKIYRCKAKINIPPKLLIEAIRYKNLETLNTKLTVFSVILTM